MGAIHSFVHSLNYSLLLYCSLFTITIFINKYILSVLKFTYPTVFQGWQTLLASLSLLFLRKCRKESLKQPVNDYRTFSNLVQRYGIMLPNLIFYVCSIVAGSKALSSVPIPIFLGAANLTNGLIYFTLNNTNSRSQFISGFLTFVTSLGILILHHYQAGNKISNVWLLTYIFFISVDALYSEFIGVRTSRERKLWYTNCFSVLVLAPASLYLHEAFSALEFALASKVKFYVSVVISGVCGGITQALSTNIDYIFYQSSAVAVAAILSPIVFADDILTSPVFQVLVINLISNYLLCVPDKNSDRNQIEMTVV